MAMTILTTALISIATFNSAPLGLIGDTGGDETEILNAPEVVLFEGAGLARQSYPTPILQDLDGDGKPELVVGDLPGRMRFAQRAGGELEWTKLNDMKCGKDPLRLNNW